METLQLVLVQLDEARRYIRSGWLPHLRIALLILDNAAELQLHRWAVRQMASDELVRRLRENAVRYGAPPELLSDLAERQLLGTKQEQRVLRDFHELLRYAAHVRKKVPVEIAELLGHVHRYRNEAHHRGVIRPATLESAAVLLFTLNLRLLPLLRELTYDSAVDYGWLESRFDIRPIDLFFDGEQLQNIIDRLSKDLPHGVNLSETLAAHLESRTAELHHTIAFLIENARDVADEGAAFDKAKEYVLTSRDSDLRSRMPRGVSGVSRSVIQTVPKVAAEIRSATSADEAFRVFGQAEADFEAAEFILQKFASAVDAAIEFQMELARGK